jgi:hypothetical protein
MTKFMFDFHLFFTKAQMTARELIVCAFITADSVAPERLLRFTLSSASAPRVRQFRAPVHERQLPHPLGMPLI